MATSKTVTRWQKLKTSINLFLFLGLFIGGIFGFLFGGFLGPVGFLIFTVGLMGIGAVCGALIPISVFALGLLCNTLLEKLPTKLSSPIYDVFMPALDFFGRGLEKLVIWGELIEQKFASGLNPLPPVKYVQEKELASSPEMVSRLMPQTPSQDQGLTHCEKDTDEDINKDTNEGTFVVSDEESSDDEEISELKRLIEESTDSLSIKH